MPDVWTYLSVVVGWVVVHFLTAFRDKKKEWREFSRETVRFVDSIEKNAFSYHSAPERDFSLEKKIKLDLAVLDLRFNLIRKHLSLRNEISFFRSAITLENFETASFVQKDYQSEILQSIAYEANLLREALFKAK